MDVSRAEIMSEVVALKALMDAVVFWSQVQGWLIVGATATVIGLVLYQIKLKHAENEKTNRGLVAVADVLAEVKEFLKLAKEHGELTDLQKNAMLAQQSEVIQVARLQASKVAMVAEKSAGEVLAAVDRVPDKVVEKIAKSAEDSGVMPVQKLPEGGNRGQ